MVAPPRTLPDICPVCGVGNLIPRIQHRTLECNGYRDTVPLHYSLCDDCGSEIADSNDIRKNCEYMKEFWRKYER